MELPVPWSVTGLSSTSLILTIVIIFLTVWMMAKQRHRLPPGPTPLPLIGNALSFYSSDMRDCLTKWRKQYGDIFTFYMGVKPIVVLSDIDVMTEMFVKQGILTTDRADVYSVKMATMGGLSIATMPYGELWKFQRKLASQSIRKYLSGSHLEERVHEVLTPIISNMLQQPQPLNPRKHISLSVVNVIHGICFGTTMDMQNETFINLVDSFDQITSLGGSGFLEDFFPPLRYAPTKRFKEFQRIFAWQNSLVQGEIKTHREDFDPENLRDLTDTILLGQQKLERDPSSVISQSFTDDHVTQTLKDVFGGGVDTTRSQILWILLVIAAQQQVQKRMIDEIDRVVGDSIPGKQHRSNLLYVEAVILEALRFYTVAPLGAPHQAREDVSISDYVIPKGTMIIADQITIHYDSKHWADPESFRPERFLENNGTQLAPRGDSFVAFSLGPRNCIGEAMVRLQMLFIIVGLLQKLTFHIPDGVEVDLSNNDAKGFFNTPRDFELLVKSR